jgi:hypothetical protein
MGDGPPKRRDGPSLVYVLTDPTDDQRIYTGASTSTTSNERSSLSSHRQGTCRMTQHWSSGIRVEFTVL